MIGGFKLGNNQKKQLTNKDKQKVKKNLEELKESYKLGIEYYENVEDKTE